MGLWPIKKPKFETLIRRKYFKSKWFYDYRKSSKTPSGCLEISSKLFMKKSLSVNKFYEDVHNVSTTVVSSRKWWENIWRGILKDLIIQRFTFETFKVFWRRNLVSGGAHRINQAPELPPSTHLLIKPHVNVEKAHPFIWYILVEKSLTNTIILNILLEKLILNIFGSREHSNSRNYWFWASCLVLQY